MRSIGRRWGGLLLAAALVLIGALALTARAHPVVLSLTPDPAEVRPITYCVMNPFRDRSPERVAESCLSEIRQQHLQVLTPLVDRENLARVVESERRWPIVRWRLGARKETRAGSKLMYWLERGNGYAARFGEEEAFIEVAGFGNDGRVVVFEPIY